MRWESQNTRSDDADRLPGLGDTVVRRFDAPEALDMRFHEVRTKSALNHVPGGTRGLPFEWTINPYRGCTHACVYCLAGETPVLLANGRARPIAELAVGDEIIGTVREGAGRRYVKTEVLAHWSTVKPAHRVSLRDGTELIGSGDHRFLTRAGWKHVTGTRRPRLQPDDALYGLGKLADGPRDDAEYRRGYLSGAIGDDAAAFPRGLTDADAAARAEVYLAGFGSAARQPIVAGPPSARPARHATGTPSARPAHFAAGAPSTRLVRHAPASLDVFTAWPWNPTSSWRKGFLAGAFDARGSLGEALEITGAHSGVTAQVAACLRRFGFGFVLEDRCVQVLGGLAEQQRFFLTVDPAWTRARSIEGRTVETSAQLEVECIEPLGVDVPMFDITTGTGDFIANGVVSHNCFARPTHEYLEFDAGRDFEREIVVKVNVPEVLRAELGRKSWRGDPIALGTNTDPYQWVEGRYKLMRGIWEVMRDFRNPCSILTKSPLVLRDLDLLLEIAEVTDVSACLSVPTLDEKAWRATEPHTPNPKARLEAVAALNEAGIPTGVLIAPLMPGVNDAPDQVERIVEAATEAQATYIGGNTLFLRGAVREIYFAWLREHRPDLLPLYERLYAKGAYLSGAEKRKIELAAGAPWALRTYPVRERHRGPRHPPVAEPRPPRVTQGSLF